MKFQSQIQDPINNHLLRASLIYRTKKRVLLLPHKTYRSIENVPDHRHKQATS